MANKNATIAFGSARLGSARLGSARLGSARLGRSIVSFFLVCQVLFHRIYNEPVAETGRIMPWLRLFAFARRWWFDIEV